MVAEGLLNDLQCFRCGDGTPIQGQQTPPSTLAVNDQLVNAHKDRHYLFT